MLRTLKARITLGFLIVLLLSLRGAIGLHAQALPPTADSVSCCHSAEGGIVVQVEDLELDSFTTLPEVLHGLVPSLYSLDVGVRNDLDRTVRLRGPSGLAICPSLPGSRNWTSLQCPGPLPLSICADCGPKVLLDGIEIGSEALATISVLQLKSIEIVPGPRAALRWGEGAASGAVLLHSIRGSSGVRAGVDFGGMRSPYVEDEEENISRGYHLTLGGAGDRISYNLAVQRTTSSGHVPSYGSEGTAAGFGFSGQVSGLDVSAFARYSERETALPGWSTAYYHLYSDGLLPSWGERIDEDDYAGLRSVTFGFAVEHRHSQRWRSRITAGSDLLDSEVRAVPTLVPGDSMTLVETVRHSRPTFRASSSVDIPLGQSLLTVEGGIDGRQHEKIGFDSYHQHANQPRVTHSQGDILEESFRTLGGYGDVRMRVAGDLLLSAGVRVEEIGYEVESIGTTLSPRVGAGYETRIGSWVLRPSASWARGYSAPSRLMVSGSNPGFAANPDADPQPTSGFEAGVEADAFDQRLSVRAGIFSQTSSQVLGEVDLLSGGARQYVNSSGSITNTGQELSLEWRDAALQIAAGASRLSSSVEGVEGYPEDVPVSDDPTPETLGYTRIRYSLRERTKLPLYAGARLTRLGRRWANDRRSIIEGLNSGLADFDRHRWFDGINRADIFLGGNFGEAFEARVEVLNVADRVDQEVPEVVVPGRQIRLSLRAQI